MCLYYANFLPTINERKQLKYLRYDNIRVYYVHIMCCVHVHSGV